MVKGSKTQFVSWYFCISFLDLSEQLNYFQLQKNTSYIINNWVISKWYTRILVVNYMVFTDVFPLVHFTTYIMSSEETRRTQSAIFFNIKTKYGEKGNGRITSNRKQDELTPRILVTQALTSTLIVKSIMKQHTVHNTCVQLIKVKNRLP